MCVKCLLYHLALFTILASHHPAFAQGLDTPPKELIRRLDSTDLHTVNQAAYDLGQMRAKEAVPALLKVLQSSRFLSELRHNIAADKNSVSEWVLTDVKATIVNSLGLIGDRRAVPVLKKYLMKPPKYSGVFPGNVAYALYLITGKSYKYRDRDGKVKLFQPSPSSNGVRPTPTSMSLAELAWGAGDAGRQALRQWFFTPKNYPGERRERCLKESCPC